MKVKPSPLELVDFFVLNQQCAFIQPTAEVEVIALFNSYQLDIDFGIRPLEEDLHQVALKVEVNRDTEPQPGYSVFCEAIGIFRLTGTYSEEEKHNLLVRSALAMLLSFIRTQLATTTAHYPMGKYWLPSIDIVDLIRQRGEQVEKETTENKASDD